MVTRRKSKAHGRKTRSRKAHARKAHAHKSHMAHSRKAHGKAHKAHGQKAHSRKAHRLERDEAEQTKRTIAWWDKFHTGNVVGFAEGVIPVSSLRRRTNDLDNVAHRIHHTPRGRLPAQLRDRGHQIDRVVRELNTELRRYPTYGVLSEDLAESRFGPIADHLHMHHGHGHHAHRSHRRRHASKRR
jgi:hypothetical protein